MSILRQTDNYEMNGKAILAPSEPHRACVLLLDTSGSMSGASIASMNKAIRVFKEQISLDELAQKCVDIAIIEFNDTARVVQEFIPLLQLQPVSLSAVGNSAMGEGINVAIDKIKERSAFYNSIGTPFYIPWIIMISRGTPTDDISIARQRVIDEASKGSHGKLKFWAIGVSGYNQETLSSFTKHCIAIDDFINILDGFSFPNVIISPKTSVGEKPDFPELSGDWPIPEDW